MEANKGFFYRNKAYILVGFGFILLTYWYFWLASIADIKYIERFILRMLHGDFTGLLQPYESLGHYQKMVAGLFGPHYKAIAPEDVRAFLDRQELLPWVFAVEFAAFFIAFIVQKGRKKVVVNNPEDRVQIYSLFQRIVILLNILMVIYIFVTGFSITFGNWTGGGEIARFMRKTHEIVGLFWIPVWFVVTVIAFKDIKYFIRPSSKLWKKIILPGSYEPMKRINYYMFVIFGFVLVVSGFLLWYFFAAGEPVATTIQLRRLLLFMHFMGSAILSFFLLETVYAYFISVGGYLPAVITGKAPREYIKQVSPSALKEIKE